MYKLLHRHYHKKYHLNYRHAKKLFFIDLALLVFAISLFGISAFLFLWNPGMMDKVDLSIKLNAARAKSGDSVCFNIDYHNRNTVKLTSPVLGVHLPEGFIINKEKTHPDYTEQSTISLPDIEPSGKGIVSICGDLWIEPNTELTITSALTYQPEETDYKEQRNTSFILKLSESNLTGELVTPDDILTSTNISVNYFLKNTSSKTIENISLTNNQNIALTNVLHKFSLASGETKHIKTTIPANTLENLNIEFTSQVLINNHYITQTINTKSINIIQPKISINANYDGNKTYVEANQSLPIQINWGNDNEYSLNNLEIELDFEPKIINLQVTAQANGLKIKNGKLIIDGDKRTALSSALSNTEDSFTIELKINQKISLQKSENPYLIVKPSLIVKLDNLNGQNYTKEGTPAQLPIATELSWNMETRYYTKEGDQLGRGSLPPQVGETTKYWILTKIWNTTSAVKDAKFTATLPIGVEFTKRQSITIGPSISFNENTRQISWSYSKLPPNSQTGLYFEVAITPQAEQVGNTVELVKNARMTAKDDFTQKELALVKNLLDNILKSDDRGNVKGNKVVE